MEVDLHITNRCNLKCEHCVYDSGVWNMPDMSLETVKKLSNGFKKMNVKEVHITGGEPLLNKEVFDIIEYLHKSGYLVRIQSNGYLINETTAKRLKDSGADHVLISIDGLHDTNNKFRGNSNSFVEACKAVKICLNERIFTRVNTVVSKLNINQLKDLIKEIISLGVDQYSFFYLTPMGRGKNLKQYILSLEEWKKVQDDILFYANNFGCSDKIRIQDVVFHEGDINYKELEICRDDNCLILANGDVYHCVFFVDTPYVLGNIYNEDISTVWNKLPELLSRINLNKKKSCSMFKCGGGCPGMSLCFGGGISVCDPRCNPKQNFIASHIQSDTKGSPPVKVTF